VTPQGQAIVGTVEDLQSQTRIKVAHARAVLADTFLLLGFDLEKASYWLDLRHLQDPKRNFGRAPTAAWMALRKVLPFQQDPARAPDRPLGSLVDEFLRSNPASLFYPSGATQF